jgi:basic amino acid/polyamine antiporter, APA family
MQEQLKRSIGVFGLASAVVNMTIGTGIFVLPALAAEHMGNAALFAFLVCGFLIFLIALCFAETGSRFSVSGGAYTYIEFAFGKYAGFLANIIFVTSCVLADAASARAVAKTLSFFWPALDAPLFRTLFCFLLFALLAFINIRGAKQGMRFIVISTVAKLIPLLLVVVMGTTQMNWSALTITAHFELNDLGASTLVLFFAFIGLETAVANGGEFKNPARTVPLGLFWGLLIVLLLYMAIQLITQGVLGSELMKYKEAPITAVAQKLLGTAGLTITVIGTALSMIGAISGEVLGIPRILYAGARDGLMPSFLFKVHPSYATPHYAILVYTACCFILSVTGSIQQLLVLSSASILLIYLGVVLSVFKFRLQKTKTDTGFKMPGGYTIPVVATIIILWVLSNLTKQELTGVVITLAALSVIYMLMQMVKKKKGTIDKNEEANANP